MRKVAMTGKTRTKAIIDLGQLGCAVLLLVAPWIFDFASEAVAAWNAWLSGCAILAAAAMALVAQAQSAQETNLALGVWVVIAPIVLGFPGHASAALVHVWLGLAVSILAAAELWLFRRRPVRRRRSAAVPFSESRSDRRLNWQSDRKAPRGDRTGLRAKGGRHDGVDMEEGSNS
jgi:hypothetical protein